MKLLALNSGGIDSPVAMHMMMEKGFDVEAVIFDLTPFSPEESIDTALDTVGVLERVHGKDVGVHIVPHGFIQEKFLDSMEGDRVRYNCLFSRRMMLRTAERLAEDIGARALVTGESLGQVASQTLDNLVVTGSAVDMQVLRPLLGMDKVEIERIAKEIGTYDVSVKGGIQCAAVIDYPETHGVVKEMVEIEEEFDIEDLVERGLEGKNAEASLPRKYAELERDN